MRHSASFTSISWIPSEAIPGAFKIPFLLGIGHYDPPPPDHIKDLEGLHRAGGFRYANRLRAFVEVQEGRIVDAGYEGGGLVSPTLATLGLKTVAIPPVVYPEIKKEPEFGDGSVRFVQTVGARTGAVMPRKVNRPPYVQISSPITWTTLGLTIRADGRNSHEVVGASPFPRHWFYDSNGNLVEKSGVADYHSWAEENWGWKTPWGDEHNQKLVTTEVETALERSLSTLIMHGGHKPKLRRIEPGQTLTVQGDAGDELYLVLDGMFLVSVNDQAVAEVDPGAVVGERAVLEGGPGRPLRWARAGDGAPRRGDRSGEGDRTPPSRGRFAQQSRRSTPSCRQHRGGRGDADQGGDSVQRHRLTAVGARALADQSLVTPSLSAISFRPSSNPLAT